MTPDVILVTGIILGVFSVPAIVSTMSDRRSPGAAIIVLISAGGLVIWATSIKPGGYSLTDVPNAFVRVIGHILN
ncbi:hypothetical protein [Roseovarius dicentrarchi]|uniref:hypothetical protein n=1 Tax=Roseovarius dicentrarchi TaxID=2250573 RepID=UPI000DEA64A5|nr:hypothetical protein [Roseovarius dicentrarchi]